MKTDIKKHLELVTKFLSSESEKFNSESTQESDKEHAQRYIVFRKKFSADYVSKFFPKTRELLFRAANLKLIAMQNFDIDGRFIEAGVIPYIDDLRALTTKMAD
ncbi:hypothetical protein [Pseudomonas botevensis]|uniref:hypothetical protein n=1 Tax=Pseudomonas botevensis TaxID=2842352 RepID=UPI001C3DE377|nr:hypothetical protein [Pseudomonas botevensis]MBV4476846.1 hypothetical protein [Pseudomonas botevensis]